MKRGAPSKTSDPSELNVKQRRFVEQYLIDLNGTQAAIRAGYSHNGAEVTGHRLLRHPKIAALVVEGQAKLSEKSGIDALWVLNEAADVYRAARDGDKLTEALRALDIVGKHVNVQAFKDNLGVTGDLTIKRIERTVV